MSSQNYCYPNLLRSCQPGQKWTVSISAPPEKRWRAITPKRIHLLDVFLGRKMLLVSGRVCFSWSKGCFRTNSMWLPLWGKSPFSFPVVKGVSWCFLMDMLCLPLHYPSSQYSWNLKKYLPIERNLILEDTTVFYWTIIVGSKSSKHPLPCVFGFFVGGSPGHHKDLLGRLDLRKAPHGVPCNEESSGFKIYYSDMWTIKSWRNWSGMLKLMESSTHFLS